MNIINGKEIAAKTNEETKKIINELNLKPGLAIVLVGNNPASEIYVKNKIESCKNIGINARLYRFDENNREEDIITCIKELNDDDRIHGIIVQSPVPEKFNEDYINSFVNLDKDVDGFGIYNMGALATNKTKFLAATPKGIIKMLEDTGINVAGKNIVIIGRSKIVGRPLALALLNMDATVTIAHSKTKDLKSVTKNADILIVAIGVANYITADYIKDGAIIVDVGINRINEKITGDVDFDSVKDKVSFITPVPGGVGPMTIASLLRNTTESAKNFKMNRRD